MSTLNYPRFIKNTPHGTDKYEGKSAERIAIAIQNQIVNYTKENELPKIIGLDGEWGSGKSNIISLLKNKLGNKYYVFEYDAWGHQEDLQRRSFLETLTSDLISQENHDLLPEKCSRKNRFGEYETWNEKLANLLARKRETTTKTRPKISTGITGAILLFVFTPISSAIASDTSLSLKNKLIIAFIPIIIALFVWLLFSLLKWKLIWSELFEIYSKDQINETVNETISESEPSVREFTDWMNDLSLDLKKELIIVFDNMDRLPAEKVKELWSSIHTFFSELRYSKIWVIIPFDRTHLANAFENKELNRELANHFINKSFPVVYRVAPPVLSDWKKVFNEFFEEAFGDTDEKLTIQRVFGIIKKDFTPRDIIAFINEMVTLKRIWGNEIPLIYIGIFSLKKDEILKSPVECILTGSYLTQINKIVENNEEAQVYISALTFGVDLDLAKQIPLMQYLRNAIKSEDEIDINKYSEHSHFIEMLDEVIKELDPLLINNAIIRLSEYKSTTNTITHQWNQITNMIIEQPVNSVSIENTHKILLNNADLHHKKKLIMYLYYAFSEKQNFSGDKFYLAMYKIEKLITENKFDIDLPSLLNEKFVSPSTFIDYTNQADSNYLRYKIFCKNDELNKYLIDLIPSNIPLMDFLEYLNDDKLYSFEALKVRIEKAIINNELDSKNFYEIFKAYKFISNEIPLEQKLTPSQIQNIFNSISNKYSEDYNEIVAMAIANRIIDVPYVEDLEIDIAHRIEYYNDYGSLLISSVNWSSILLRKTLRYVTLNKELGQVMNIEEVLPYYEQIKTAIGVNDIEFLNRLEEWSNYAKTNITIDNISSIIPNYSFYNYTSTINNELTIYLNQLLIEKIKNIPLEDLYSQRNAPENYWLNSVSILIHNNIIKSLPDNLTELCKKILIDISNGAQVIPLANSVLDNILKKADKRNLHPTIKHICLDFCNKKISITPTLFLFFSKEYDFLNKVNSREGDITSTILNTIIRDTNCLEYIVENSIEHIKIINSAGDDANDLKAYIKQSILNNKSEKLRKFAESIGISNEENDVTQ